MKTLSIIIVIWLSLLQGCSFNDTFNSRLEFIPNGNYAKSQPVSPNSIQVFRSSLPERKFIEVGTISAQFSSYETTLNKLKEKAAQNGADALVDVRESAVGVMTRITATAIKFN